LDDVESVVDVTVTLAVVTVYRSSYVCVSGMYGFFVMDIILSRKLPAEAQAVYVPYDTRKIRLCAQVLGRGRAGAPGAGRPKLQSSEKNFLSHFSLLIPLLTPE